MNRAFILLFLLALQCFAKAHVERKYFFKSKIANKEIVFKIDCYDESPERNLYYYFMNDKRDRFLQGQKIGNKWIYKPRYIRDSINDFSAITILENTTKDWQLYCRNNKEQEQQLTFTFIDNDSLKNNYNLFLDELDSYEKVKILAIHFNAIGKQKLTKKITVEWLSDSESKQSFIQLKCNSKKIDITKVNEALLTNHFKNLIAYYGYENDWYLLGFTTTLMYYSDSVLSFMQEWKNNKTKGNQKQFFNYNIVTGDAVDLEEWLWIDSTAARPSLTDLYKIYKYRKNIFAPFIQKMLVELFPEKMNQPNCPFDKIKTWETPQWIFTFKGLSLETPYSNQCPVSDWAIIPYNKLSSYLKKYQASLK